MKKTKAKTRLEAAADFFRDTLPCLVKLSAGEDEAGNERFDDILFLGKGDMIWLATVDGPESPVLNIDDLLTSKDTDQDMSGIILDLFTAEIDEDLNEEKFFAFENLMRKILKTYNLPKEKEREIKIAFLDVKEEYLAELE